MFRWMLDGDLKAGVNVWGWIAPDDMWANADSLLDRSHPKYRAIRDFAASAK